MAEAARSVSARANRGLPYEIVIWEILVRLPPKALLRCRAVCRAWHHATSAHDFLLAHHAHQPVLPVAFSRDVGYPSIVTFDHRAADAQLQRVTRLENRVCGLYYSCDGLLLLCSHDTTGTYFCICNPATRQSARLPIVSGYVILGMYRHHPTGEYRVLMYLENQEINGKDACYIFTLGSVQVQPPRNIGWQPEAKEVYCSSGQPVLLRGSLHCPSEQREIGSNNIVVFDTSTELFRQMRAPVAPVAPRYNALFEMDRVLGMYICSDGVTIIDIWMLLDYENEVWTFKCKIALPVTEINMMCGMLEGSRYAVVVPGNGELLVLVKFAGWLLQVDMDGKLVATFHRKEVFPTQLQLKQTLVPHAFFQH
ncbi:F-box protein At5g49610-like [Triticum aestivum]|uniref:F-box protein At5g49610-like n=1 Tax=Triticum aestivum TaxID=4565 RepID=UPI00162D60CD|nr:F-box protein At5g49610-like [Triticum aestivum]